ncbi:MAG: SAVED domain-containing protein [Proteobacteria bacterium]|nr:SAVED domain-containing protein [Pseudomonadota bacterium]
MMELFLEASNWITKYFDGIGIVLGIISAVPIFWTWYSLTWGQKRKEKRWTQNAINHIHGKIHCVLIVDLLPNKDIKTPVLRYLKQNEHLKNVQDEFILHISHETSTTPENLTEFAKELQSIHKSLQQLGADSIHLFFAGPGIAATLIGTEFGNSIPVYLYHHDKTYENFGLMNRRYI